MSFQPATTKVRPGALWYLLGALAIAAGIGAFVASLVIGAARMSDTVDNFTRFTVGRDGIIATVDFAKPGTYTLYYEYPSGADDARQRIPSDLAVKIVGAGNGGATVPFASGGDEVSFSIGDSKRAGRSAGEFTLPASGKYDIQVTGGQSNAPFEMAVGKGVLKTFGRTILLGAGVGAALGLLGVVVLIVTGVKRKRAKRIAQAQAAAWAGTPGAPEGTPSWPPVGVPSVPAAAPSWPPGAPVPAHEPPTVPAPAYGTPVASAPPVMAPPPPPASAGPAPAAPAAVPPPPAPPAPTPPLPPPAYDPGATAPQRGPWDPPAPQAP